jgi:DNA invertase Pin-like site-specific DNA recombinase
MEAMSHDVILYLRQSDAETDAQLTNHEDQLRKRADRLGWRVLRCVIENDVPDGRGGTKRRRVASAFKRRKVGVRPNGTPIMRVVREGFSSVLEDLEEGRGNALLVVDLDRILRNPRDGEDLLDVAEAMRVNAQSLTGTLTLTDGGTAQERQQCRSSVNHATASSEDTSRRVAAARQRDVDAGRKWHGGRKPFGYKADGVTVDPVEAAVVRDMAQRLLLGESLHSLVAELKDRKVSGRPWSSQTLRGILVRPRTAGMLVHRGGVVETAAWEPLLGTVVFEAVGTLLRDPARVNGPGPAPRHLGTSVYVCGACTRIVQTTRDGHGRLRYRCPDLHASAFADAVDPLVEASVVDCVELIATGATRSRLQGPTAPAGVDTEALQARRRAIRTNLDSMASDRALGLIDRDEMLAANKAGKAALAEIDKELTTAFVGPSAARRLSEHADVAVAWTALPLSTKRTIIRETLVVTLLPVDQRGDDGCPVRIVPIG